LKHLIFLALHNASSFGHVDVATLLITYHSDVNARDNWSYTPLHEAASKGRTQLCSLLLAHGANPHLRNQDNQTPIDLATADDVKSLLLDAMSIPMSPTSQTGNRYRTTLTLATRETTSILGAETNDNNNSRQRLSSASNQAQTIIQRHLPSGDGSMSLITDDERREQALHMTMDEFLSLCQFQSSQQQDILRELFECEHITLDILAEMTHNDLKEIGIAAYGERHKLLKNIERLYKQAKDPWSNIPDRESVFIELDSNDQEYRLVQDEVNTIKKYRF
jgi:tankyrase